MDAEQGLAIGIAIAGVRHCLFVCGLIDAATQDAVISEGYVNMASFAELQEKDIHEMVKSINARPNPLPPVVVAPATGRGRGRGRGRARERGEVIPPPPIDQAPNEQMIQPALHPVRITRRAARRLGGLVHWVKDKIRRGIRIDPYDFDEEVLVDALQEVEGEEIADTVEAELPEKFTPERWVQWEIEITNYLSTKKGIRGIPLSYVIRPDLEPGDTIAADDITRQELYNAPLEGGAYKRDNNAVWAVIRANTIATAAWEWIKQIDGKGDGRLGMQKLRAHYDGPDKRKARINASETIIENLHYRGERYMPFEKFVTKLNGAYQVLDHYNEPHSETKKLRTLLLKIHSNDSDVIAGVAAVCIANPPVTFDEAIATLADIIRAAQQGGAQANRDRQPRRVALATTAPGRNPGFSRFGRGRDGRSVGGRSNNSNQSNQTNFVSYEVWNLLTPAQKSAIA
jgi:hypothetical protein